MRILARPASGALTPGAHATSSPDAIAAVLEDSSHLPDGRASGLAFPRTEADVAHLLRTHAAVLPIGAQSSVTGGATPLGDVVLSTARLDRIVAISRDRVRVQAGVPLAALQARLAERGAAYPPGPTYEGAFVGGTIATSAAGAATFKYGTTRDWVEAITVVLPSGDVLDIDRGSVTADGRRFEIETASGTIAFDVPAYAVPAVPKCAAGYYAAPGMDLVDLFIGAEGTLGVITEATLRILSPAPAACVALVPCPDEARAIALVARLRDEARTTRRSGDPHALDIAAIESLDHRSLALVREDGADTKHGVCLPPGTDTLLLVRIDLPAATTSADVFDQVGRADDSTADGPLVRFCRILAAHDVLDDVEVAGPDEKSRTAQFVGLREAVPAAVNQRVARARHAVDPRITKTAADMIVPFDRFADVMRVYRERFAARGLEYAIWGHASDGNLHPNVLPRSWADVEAGRAAILEIGRAVIRMGGSPLAEHGVGRNPVKQALLRELYGDAGIEQMRAVKRALDPDCRLARGVLFA